MHAMRILLVDDEAEMLEVCRDTLVHLDGVEIQSETSSKRAAERLAHETFDLMLADIRMPEIDGVELLRRARQHHPQILVIMLTAYPALETAVESMKLGAMDYITKPFLPDDLLAKARRLLEEARLREENRTLSRFVGGMGGLDEMLGGSPAMRELFQTIDQVSETDAGVLISGETGSGKELVARSIHRRSRREGQRFVPIDCGAIPEHLLESELFGHERGAFTGAHARSVGLLEIANRGSLFLDELSELPRKLQAKLLRALQEKRIRRVGGKQEITIDVRVIAATSRELKKEMDEGRFRDDLYYRINVISIHVPPLRDRGKDIGLLASHYAARYADEMDKAARHISPEALEVLKSYSWPGNVRELQNVLRRAIALSRESKLTLNDLPDHVVIEADARCTEHRSGYYQLRARRMEAFEREYLTRLLSDCRGDVALAAVTADLARGTLYRLMSRHGLKATSFRPP